METSGSLSDSDDEFWEMMIPALITSSNRRRKEGKRRRQRMESAVPNKKNGATKSVTHGPNERRVKSNPWTFRGDS